MVYFTADLHLGHAAILKYCHRPFASVQEMDRTLIENWNRCVRDGDTVYVLGDMIWPKKKAPEYLAALKGNIILLRGNHDVSWLKQTPCEGWPTQIQEYAKIRIAGRGVTLCHYPLLEWEDSRPQFSTKPGYLIHGHIHNNVLPEYTVILKQYHALNAGVDVNGFMPVTFEQLQENNEKFKLSVLQSPIDRAYLIASRYHEGQKDKAGKPYIEHPVRVSSFCEDEITKTVALLHDVLEDTCVDEALLETYFAPEVLDAVRTMTHGEDEEYFDYIRRVAAHPVARVVKAADLRHNMDLSRLPSVTERDQQRMEKYRRAVAILNGEEI
ncbi:MAG: metallophosphoesterase family protein [Clostridia bacterium]|nr:metallophosphoesterase family protein [Clostridia bacterium]MBQ8718805.1 metallophosphoesterase family protein [Clostridia bacterium]